MKGRARREADEWRGEVSGQREDLEKEVEGNSKGNEEEGKKKEGKGWDGMEKEGKRWKITRKGKERKGEKKGWKGRERSGRGNCFGMERKGKDRQ